MQARYNGGRRMSLPNALTVSRIILTALLFIPASLGWRVTLVSGFVIAFITDLLDGYLARKLGQTSYIGMRLDSLADYFLFASAAVWTWLLEPTLFTTHSTLWISLGCVLLVPQTICVLRLGKNAGFHLYSTKAAGWSAAILFLHAVLSGRHSAFLLDSFAVLTIIKSIEETLICLLVRDPYNDLRPSVLLYLLPGTGPRLAAGGEGPS